MSSMHISNNSPLGVGGERVVKNEPISPTFNKETAKNLQPHRHHGLDGDTPNPECVYCFNIGADGGPTRQVRARF